LQAVLDANGNVVERVLYGDAYGDAPHYVQGPAIDKITFTPNNDGSVDIRVRANERVKQLTIASGVRLVALKSDDSVAATSGATPTLDSDEVTIHWHLSGTEWTALTSGAARLQVSVTSSLRTYAWGDTSFSSVPDFARKLYTAKSDANVPVIVTSLLSTLASVPAGTDEPLYEIKSLYMAGFDYSKTKLLTGFHALPFNEPANGLIFARARWYDPSTGSFLTPDPIGYHDASSLYAFASGDPVNGRDPSGLREATQEEQLIITGLAAKKARIAVDYQQTGMAVVDVYAYLPVLGFYRVNQEPEYEIQSTAYLIKDDYGFQNYEKQIDDDIAAFQKQIAKAKRGEPVKYEPIAKVRLEKVHRQLQWLAIGDATMNVLGCFAATAEHARNIAELDRSVPEGMVIPEGFAGYVKAERGIDLRPNTLAEIEDALRLNAMAADTAAGSAGTARTFGRYGTRAHSEFESLNIQLNEIIKRAGNGYEIRVEEFRDASGNVTGRREGGSLGVDVVVYYRGKPVAGFDLKTGRGWSPGQLEAVQKRFGVDVKQIHTR
jgi:RHS repeat-associated protein